MPKKTGPLKVSIMVAVSVQNRVTTSFNSPGAVITGIGFYKAYFKEL